MGGTERFEQIRAATLAVFYEKGYHGASLRDIAKKVGIKVPSLYNYISSKQDLLRELMTAVMEDLIAQSREEVQRASPGAESKLATAIRTFVLYNIRHPHEAAVSDAEFKALTPENQESLIRRRDEFESIFVQLIEEGIDEGCFLVPDVHVAKNTILSACARIYFWYRPTGSRTPNEVADLLAEHLMAGLLPRPGKSHNGRQAPGEVLRRQTGGREGL